MSDLLLADMPPKGRKENDETIDAVRAMIEQFALMVAAINFPTTAVAGAIGDAVPVLIETQDANDVRMLFGDNAAGRVQVDLNGGTAATPELSADQVTWGASATVEFTRGQAVVYARGSAAGTIVLTLVDVAGSGLTLGGDATVTLS